MRAGRRLRRIRAVSRTPITIGPRAFIIGPRTFNIGLRIFITDWRVLVACRPAQPEPLFITGDRNVVAGSRSTADHAGRRGTGYDRTICLVHC